METNISKTRFIQKSVESSIMMVIGILLFISHFVGMEMTIIVFPISLIVAGLALVIMGIFYQKGTLKVISILGYISVAFGIYTLVSKDINFLLVSFIYLLLILGCGTFIEAFLGKYVRKVDENVAFALKMIGGLSMILVGILFLTLTNMKDYLVLFIGISLFFIALYDAILSFYIYKQLNKE